MTTRELSTSTRAASTERTPIESLFARMTAIVGAPAMARLLTGSEKELVDAEWSEALRGFSPAEITRGLDTMRTRSRYAPNLPEFLMLCRPALDPEVAWHEAERGFRAHAGGFRFPWSHPAVFWCGRDFAFELRSSSFAEQRKRWERRLLEWFAVGSYPDIPDPTARRIESGPSQETLASAFTEDHRERLAQIRDKLAASLTNRAPTRRPANPEEIVPGSEEDVERTNRLKAESAQRYRAWLVGKGLACDGNHGGPACEDPQCWQR